MCSILYYMRPSMGERGDTLHFSIPSINQSGSFGSIFLALATLSTMVPTMPKAIYTFGYTMWMPLTVPLGFAPVCYLYKSPLYDLKNYRIKISKKEAILPRGWRGRFLIFGGRCPGGLLTCGPTCQCFTKPIRVPHEAEQR